MRVLYQLVNPFTYLTIKHEAKQKVDWIAPLAATSLTTAAFYLLNYIYAVDIFSPNGALVKILSFAQSLPGFYIAALAAIATFNRKDIDYAMPAPAPQIEILTAKGNIQEIDLTRRRFLCLMFAFLTAESILLIMLAIGTGGLAGAVKTFTPSEYHVWLKTSFVWIYGFLLWQMVAATFWGLYYLGSKLHESEDHRPPPPQPVTSSGEYEDEEVMP